LALKIISLKSENDENFVLTPMKLLKKKVERMRLVNTIEILEARKPSIFWNVQFWDSGQNGVNMKKKCDFEFF